MSPSKKVEQEVEELEDKGGFDPIQHESDEGDENPLLQDAIKEIKESRVRLYLNLSWYSIVEADIKSIAEAIKEARAPLTLRLDNNGIGANGAESLAQCLKEAQVPINLLLDYNNIGDAGAKFLSEGIKEARVPVTLRLGGNGIGASGTEFLAQGLKEAQAPIILNLSGNGIGDAGAELLAQSFKEAQVPLYLDLHSNEIGDAGAGFLAQGLKEARVPITLYLSRNKLRDDGAEFLAEAIKVAQGPINLHLDHNEIGTVGVRFLAEAIKVAQNPLNLQLSSNRIGAAGARFLAEAIKEVRVPINLNLSWNKIGYQGVVWLAVAIKVAQVPIELNLSNNNIGCDGARLLAEGIKETRVPLKLNLNENGIAMLGAGFLAQSIKEAQVPIDLNLNTNSIGDVGAGLLAQSIKEAQVPITLNLSYNNIGCLGTDFLAEAIKVAQFPIGLFLYDHNIGEASAQLFAEAIRLIQVPLYLNLSWNAIGEAGKRLIIEATKVARAPLTLDNGPSIINSYIVGHIGDNFVVDAGTSPSEFLKRIKFSPSKRILEARLGQVSVIATIVQEYIGDKELAWIEVAAIRAVEGASYENKYSSINYKLLTEAYSTVPASSVSPALEVVEMEDDGQPSNSASQSSLVEGPLRPHKRKQASDQEKATEQAAEARPLKERRQEEHQESSTARDTLRSNKRKRLEDQDEFKGQGTLDYTDNSYPEYYNSGIDRVLKLRLSGVTNSISLKSRYFGNDLGYKAWQLASDVGSILSLGNQVVVPINLDNKHWVGLLFKGFGDRVEVTYMDSEQATMLPSLRSGLENGLLLKGYESRIEEARLTPQRYNNCGYEVIENFVYYLTGTRATQGGAMYVHSLLVENSLLDPEVYGLKLEENNKLIGFLSNAEPIGIQELTLFAEQWETKHEKTVPNNSLERLKTYLLRASVWFKTLDFVVDSARLVQEPSLSSFKKLVLDYAYLQAMVSGANSYSAMIAGAEAMYQLQLGEYQKAFNVASSTISAMALPAILAMANRPYLGAAYGAWAATSTAYGAITNAYSFVMELGSSDVTLRSAMAYKDLAEWLAASPIQALHDFEAKAKEYKLQINDLLFGKEKAIIQAQMKGEFGQKVFDYIYLPELIEKYVLLNDVIKGELTEEEAKNLKSKPVAISYGALEYDHCMRTEDFREETAEHYYCCNIARQVLDHVVLTGSGGLEVLESL